VTNGREPLWLFCADADDLAGQDFEEPEEFEELTEEEIREDCQRRYGRLEGSHLPSHSPGYALFHWEDWWEEAPDL